MGVQTRTAVADPRLYTQNMRTNLVKAALMGAWVLVVGAFGYMSGTTSLVGWTLLAVVLVVAIRSWTIVNRAHHSK